MWIRSLAAALVFLLALPASAQITPLPFDEGATGLGLALRHLPVSGRVLYITAHPDDENNGVLVMLNRGRGLETALQTVTRGDGGQNEIGPELFQAIGILRTEELAALHRYDGARQFFSSAYEFGYSFSVEETFQKWGREEILRDVVRAVRIFRPDVILTLPLVASGGGQHHQASAQLGREAFRAAADPARFPEQLQEGLLPWQAHKIYQGGTGGGAVDGNPVGTAVVVSTSDFDPLLGASHFQFGMLSRTMHKCQGAGQLGAFPADGKANYLLVDSEPKVTGAETDILQGVDTTLAGVVRFARGQEAAAPFLAGDLQGIAAAAQQAQAAYDPKALGKTLAPLATGLKATRGLLEKVQASTLSGPVKYELAHRLRVKEQDFVKALQLAQGLVFRATVDDGDAVRGQTVNVTARVFNLGAEPVKVDDVVLRAPEGWTVTRTAGDAGTLAYNQKLELKFSVTVGAKARYAQPYWKKNPKADRWDYDVPGDAKALLPWSAPDLVGELKFTAAGAGASASLPVYHRYEGRWVGGEKQKVLNVVPAVAVALEPEIAVVPLSAAKPRREFRVTVLNNAKAASSAVVRLDTPAGWAVEPKEAKVELRFEGEEIGARFFVTPPAALKPGEFEVRAVVTRDGEDFRDGYQTIAYDHIQERHLFHPAVSFVKAVDVRVEPGMYVGYVRGAGDEVPPALEQLGFKIDYLTPDDLAYADLSKYTTIVTGIRAYQTRKDLKASNNRLLKYAEDGGNLVIQYNKFEFNQLAAPSFGEGGFPFGRPRDSDSPFAPYPAAVSTNRITVEETPLKVLVPGHALLTKPNAIGAADWDGWVQERGLYFLTAKDARYVDLLAATDPWPNNAGEKKGMLTTASVGKGTWTYVGLGLWRQLPAGTTGAYRLMANILSRPRGR